MTMPRLRHLILFLGYCLWMGSALSAEPVRIGVLAFQDKAATLAQWQPTAVSLAQAVANTEFQIVPLSYEELDDEVAHQRLAFVLTNPEHYVVLRNQHKLRPMATLSRRIGEQVVAEFGSVIFSRKDLAIQTLSDVAGKRVAAVGLNSLGGYLAGADILVDNHVDLSDPKAVKLSFLGVPHSRVVQAVVAGEADVGIVRTGVLEQMAGSGQLDLAQLRVLNQQPTTRFPQLLSTDLYPEWPWAAMPGTSNALTKAVLVALLQIPADSHAAKAGGFQGFTVPANYTGVEELMRRRHAYPGAPEEAIWDSVWEHYEGPIKLALALVAIAMLLVLLKVWRSNQHLLELTQLSRATRPVVCGRTPASYPRNPPSMSRRGDRAVDELTASYFDDI